VNVINIASNYDVKQLFSKFSMTISRKGCKKLRMSKYEGKFAYGQQVS
jgi:hypothetical protein